MKTTRREFIETAAGVAGSVALGAIGLRQAAGAAENGPVRLITYRGLRPTDPGGRLGLRNPERGWPIPSRPLRPLFKWIKRMPSPTSTRSQFEYIQDHLGYRLELQNARIPEKVKRGEEFKVDIELINRGFSTIHHRRPVCLALMDRAGTVTELAATGADPRQWQPFLPGDAEYKPLVHKITWAGPLPAHITSGWHQIGLWLPDAAESLRLDARYAMRLANRDLPWWTNPQGNYGINQLGVIEAVP